MFSSRATWWQLATVLTFLLTLVVSQSDLGSVAASFAVAAAAAMLTGCGGTVLRGVTRSVTDRPSVRNGSHRTVFITQCDPDAAGRPRPRAPGRFAHR